MASDTASGGLNQLEDHYKTFIVSLVFSPVCSNSQTLENRRSKTSHRSREPGLTGSVSHSRTGQLRFGKVNRFFPRQLGSAYIGNISRFYSHPLDRYFLKAVQWARKYGIRINLDLHALPGSQNGWNHSGRLGDINMLNGPMGLANAQRSLDYIRVIAEFISQPEYKDVVAMFGVTNEPFAPTFGQENLAR